MRYDVMIIGGGAAGLFCAIEAGKRSRKVIVIERNAEPARKVIISGGGRCNFTNINVGPENFVSKNPHFCKSALAGYSPQDFVALVKKYKIDHYEKTLGQLFCRGSSRQIVDMLLAECRKARVELITNCSVSSVANTDGFEVVTDRGTYRSSSLVIATGGWSFEKVGATGFGYDIARQFGHSIVATRPSLVPMVLKGEHNSNLAGVSAVSVVTTNGAEFRENVLFTHRGLSGPAILQISNYWEKAVPVLIDLLPEISSEVLFEAAASSRKTAGNFLSEFLPAKLALRLSGSADRSRAISTLKHTEIEALIERIKTWQVRFERTEGFDRAEVTLGGVSTDELSSKTMGSLRVKGLYFIGEVVDVTGWLGGYNFQWAWSSAYAAAQAV